MGQEEDSEQKFEAARSRLDKLSKQRCLNASERCLFQEALNELSIALEELHRSKEWLRLVLKAAKVSCWEWDIQADKIFWQGELLVQAGLEHGYALNPGKYWLQKLIHLEDRHKVNSAVKGAADSDADYDLEARMVLPQGEVRWIASKERVFSDQQGRPARMIGIDADITDSKLAERALQEAESRQRAILNNIPDMAWLKDAQSRFIAVNEPFARACGRTPEDLVGKSDSEIWPKDLVEWRGADDADLMGRREQEIGEELPANGEGKLRWIETIKTPIFNDQGQVIGATGIARDVTERKRAKEALQASEEMYRSLVEQAAEGILLCRLDGTVLAVNAQLCQMLGYSQEDLLRRKCTDLIPEEESMRDPLHLRELECGKSFVTALVLRHKDGREIPVEISGKALQQERVQAMIRDISGRKKAEEALLRYSELLENLVAERTEQLQKAERLAVIGETAAMIGHDLRNPLQVMTCMLFLAKEQLNSGNLLPPEGQPSLEEILRTMEESADYMEKIISDLQDYARPLKMELVETDLEALVKETLASINVPSGVTVSLEAEPSLPLLALSPQKLKRVVINLVNNAVQAMPDGGHITISILCRDGWARVAVKDTGAGIKEEVLPRIFQPLFTTRARGTGLGLVVCKRLVEAMGGRITIKSKAGSGTDVIIKIPARREDED